MHTPFELKATKNRVDKKPINTIFNAIMLGILSFPGLACSIFISSSIKVIKNPLTAAIEAIE